jgi:drug/metabolite transporter (DMT)-like permease
VITALLGLGSALIFGAADFIGGVAARRLPVLYVTVIMALSGLLTLLVVQPFTGGRWSAEAVVFGGASGLCGAIAVILLYRCLAIGPMSILSPITAVVSAIFPVAIETARGAVLDAIGYTALAIALVAVVMVSTSRSEHAARPTLPGLSMAIGSGLMIGVFYLLIDLTPDDSGFIPLIANRAANATLVLVIIAVVAVVARARSKRPALLETGPDTSELPIVAIVGPVGTVTAVGGGVSESDSAEAAEAVATPSAHPSTSALSPAHPRLSVTGAVLLTVVGGVIDIIANVLMLIGFRVGDLSVMTVLIALYPAGTILLAAFVLRERVSWVQGVGMVLALVAAGMLSLL